MQLPPQAFEASTLIVAHPDDEVLWFAAVLERVDKIVICFTDAEHAPAIGDARRRSLNDHACRDKIVELGICQVKSHNRSRWPEPEETEYGLRLDKLDGFDQPYREQADRLSAALAPHIERSQNVFTHNPWGEYGHEDHVQVSRVASRLAGESGAATWYSNYVSNKSSAVMRRYLCGFSADYYTMPVDTARARELADTYFRNGAWTWMDDYRWFSSECYVRGPLQSQRQPTAGNLFPVNY